MQVMDAHLFNEFSGLMLLANDGKLLAFLGCAVTLFGVFHLVRPLFRRLPMGVLPDEKGGASADPPGVSAASLQAVESRLREAGVAEAHIPARLRDATSLSELRERLEGVQPEALALIDRGDFEAAAAALKQDCELSLAPIDVDRDPGAARKDAELHAAAAAIDQLNLDYRAAADKYAAAAHLVRGAGEPRTSGGAEWRFCMAQARALADDGAQRGHGESFLGAIESYDRALDAVSRNESPFPWAATQFHRADALLASGVNDNEASRVEEAVSSYQLALEEWTHDAAPFEWARTQHDLGEALQRLAEMEDGVERPRPAADAYRAALREWTKRAAPDLFAPAQGNLGDVLAVLGARTGDEVMLREAICAYRAALGELRREVAPQEWARMQNNLGNALEALSEHEFSERKYGRDQLRQAVEAFESALEGQTPEGSPAEFAATSVNLGDALLALGEGEAADNPAYGHDLLRRAAAAYRAALSTVDGRAPVDAAKIKINLAYALGLLWNGTRNRQMLNEALAMLDGAIATIKGTPERQHVADAERARERILAALAQAA
ncbi:hypothetical protein [Methylocella sp.]|jgi:tetratricopeptide (TPR) repeat protein|uniref:hypothetical protein n=1 Tax=Methylocella sp. TaxID=1978226 RepID=UPI003C17463E